MQKVVCNKLSSPEEKLQRTLVGFIKLDLYIFPFLLTSHLERYKAL